MNRTLSLEHEELRVVRGRRSGITIAVALHSAVAGRATGGCRIKAYDRWQDGVEDALRLSTAMTLKCALGGLPYGGGKTVATVTEPLTPTSRHDLIDDIGELVGSFNGRYITGPDIGTTPEDMTRIHAATGGAAFCRPESSGGSGNSSTATARGVLAALQACLLHTFGRSTAAGLRAGIIGHGHVGSLIAQALAAQGATVTVHDLDERHRRQVEQSGLTWWSTPRITDDLDILVPAATGGLLTPGTAATCGARVVVGPANNQLTDDSVDDVLRERGVNWIPDVLASGGGVIYAVSREGLGLDHACANNRVDAIGATTSELLAAVRRDGTTPLQAARLIAKQRMGAAS